MENTQLNKTQAIAKSLNIGNWLFGRLNQLFIKGFCAETKFSKKKNNNNNKIK